MATIKYFGQIAERTSTTEEHLDSDNLTIKGLVNKIHQKYAMDGIRYFVALNQEIIDMDENTEVNEQDEIAILPPFAGG